MKRILAPDTTKATPIPIINIPQGAEGPNPFGAGPSVGIGWNVQPSHIQPTKRESIPKMRRITPFVCPGLNPFFDVTLQFNRVHPRNTPEKSGDVQ